MVRKIIQGHRWKMTTMEAKKGEGKAIDMNLVEKSAVKGHAKEK